MKMIDRCIELIESNRISSTEVADALGKKGVLPGFTGITQGKFLAGKVHYVYAYDNSNWPVHDQIRHIPPNCVLYVDAFNCENRAIFGDLVTKYIVLYQKAKGIVVNGALRDIPDLKKYGFPIWCKGFSPLGCYNVNTEPSRELQVSIDEVKLKMEDSIMVCDDTGCTMIEKDEIGDGLLGKLEMIELQEDIWSYCINTLKWSTYDTVCMKKYLTNPESLPEILREKVKNIPFKN